ncbi:RteC domain-containing protein [Prevotella sp. kh1p2]|uniref:RteC domain-containing protein n=1 Tax=Prevotella sp. kh1p2 TaxID=1761883 RepID=UPI0008C8F589|nr:RteC domain-containing protein [Prevotella sp. kh1p2]SES78939.1 RteC protein [Prevotella sp. kh1p2]SNU10638.1 RteC protein [Prevotellaceae bacterium KH2P17]
MRELNRLTKSKFFRIINGEISGEGIEKAYESFIHRIAEMCSHGTNGGEGILALIFAYTEIEIEHAQKGLNSHSAQWVYAGKAVSLMKKVVRYYPLFQSSVARSVRRNKPSKLQWTGKAVDLMELVYGLDSLKCINEGNLSLLELSEALCSFFNFQCKDCYRVYSDIKLRKKDSRTYFLDNMSRQLNRRMEDEFKTLKQE